MELTFLGAAKTVTGSMHLLTTANGSRILLDCGMYQGRRSEAFQINSHLPFDPSSIDAVVLSHAHIDHSGNLPSLISSRYPRPFGGYIHCTHATRDLCSIMLPDSAHIQESDAAFLRKKKRTAVGPLYPDDALQLIEQFASVPTAASSTLPMTFRQPSTMLATSLARPGWCSPFGNMGKLFKLDLPVMSEGKIAQSCAIPNTFPMLIC